MPRVSRVTSVGSSRSIIGCGSSSRNTRTRGLATTRGLSAIIMQDVVLGMTPVRFAGAKEHPEHRHEANERNGASHRNDQDISPKGVDQMIMHADVDFICLSLVRLPLAAPLPARRGYPTRCARN